MSPSNRTLTILAVVLALGFLASAQWPPVKSGPGDKPCNCFRTFYPVCGSDNRTYLSRCHLDCAMNFYPDLKFVSLDYCPGANRQYVVGDLDPSAFPWSG